MVISKVLKNGYLLSTGLLVVCYTLGIVGLCSPYQQQVLPLTPLILLATAGLLLGHHQPWHWPFVRFCGVAGAIGFFVEVVGVHTGMIFGSYYYGTPLGWQLWGVPVVIGLNWVILVYIAGHLVSPLSVSLSMKCFLGALMVVLIDWLMEPVAVQLGFWYWTGQHIPTQNYVAWYVLAWGLLRLFYRVGKHPFNPLAPIVYGVLLGFFGVLGWVLT
ncbi:MAG: carotenoid biosynthesis protein [Bacteroidota bacterium]